MEEILTGTFWFRVCFSSCNFWRLFVCLFVFYSCYSNPVPRRKSPWWDWSNNIKLTRLSPLASTLLLYYALCSASNINIEWDRLTDNVWNALSSSSSYRASLPEELLCRVQCSPWWSPCTPPCQTPAGCHSCPPDSPPPRGCQSWTHIVQQHRRHIETFMKAYISNIQHRLKVNKQNFHLSRCRLSSTTNLLSYNLHESLLPNSSKPNSSKNCTECAFPIQTLPARKVALKLLQFPKSF